MSKLTLPLEVGKKYVRRDGGVSLAHSLSQTGTRMFFDTGPDVSVTTGVIYVNLGEHGQDILRDHVEPAKGHPHAALMALYAQDAAETAEPWTRWECLPRGHSKWIEFEQISWSPDAQYRRKPKTIRIGEYDVPEPLRAAPAIGTQYWCPTIAWARHTTMPQRWADDDSDRRALSRGVAHLRQEAAEIHTRALLALTEKKS